MNCHRKHINVVGVALLALIVGCEQSHTIEPLEQKETASGYANPQLVFDEAKAAAIANDVPRILRCFSSESQDGFATYTLVAASMLRFVADGFSDRGDDRYVASKAKIDALLRKYSVDLSAVSKSGFEPGSPNVAIINGIAESISDKPTFISELLHELEAAKGGDTTGFQDELIGNLADVKIRGNFAEGVVTNSKSAANEPMAYYFQKNDDGWLIHMPLRKE